MPGRTARNGLLTGLLPARLVTARSNRSTRPMREGSDWPGRSISAGGGSQEATPLYWNGSMFGITNWSIIFAVDARTGKEKWRWDPEVNRQAVQPKVCCGVVNRGLAIYQGKIIAPVIDGRLEGLDAETGKVIWEARVAFPQENYTITMAPRIANSCPPSMPIPVSSSGGSTRFRAIHPNRSKARR